MLSFKLVCVFFISSVSFSTTVTLLDRGEPYEALYSDEQFLYVGKSRQNFRPDYRVEIYNSELKLVSSIQLAHSATFLHSYGKNRVIITGTTAQPHNHTAYTIIENIGKNKFNSKVIHIPQTAWAYRWLATVNGRDYFSDPGGNVADDKKELSQKSQTIFSFNGYSAQYLSVRMSLPIAGLALANKLIVLQKEGIGNPDSNLAMIDVNSQQFQYLFSSPRQDLKDMLQLENSPYLVLLENGAQQLLAIDTSKNNILMSQIKTGKDPRTMTQYGSCVVVGNQADRTIQVFELNSQGQFKELLTLPIEKSISELYSLNKIALNPATSQLFIRSNYPCNPMVETCESDWNRVEAISLPSQLTGNCLKVNSGKLN